MRSKKDKKLRLHFIISTIVTISSTIYGTCLLIMGSDIGRLILLLALAISALSTVIPLLLDKETVPNDAYEQKVQAILLEKGKHIIQQGKRSNKVYYATFELTDGARYTFKHIYKKAYKTLLEKENGVLVYDFIKNKYIFKKFEHTNEQVPFPAPIASLPTNELMYETDERSIEEISIWNNRMYRLIMIASLPMIPIIVFLALESIIALVSVIAISLFLIICLVRDHVSFKKLMHIPEQQKTVRVVKKDKDESYITFSFVGSYEKRIYIPDEVYTTLIVGDEGILTYKKQDREIIFIDFESTK